MKRLWKPLLCLLIAALTLSGCSGQPSNTEQFPEVDAGPGPRHPDPGAHCDGTGDRHIRC